MFIFYYIGGTSLGLIIRACAIGFNFGGNFALFPAATADYFGNKNVGTNYGWVFLACGVAGIAGPYIAAFFSGSVPKFYGNFPSFLFFLALFVNKGILEIGADKTGQFTHLILNFWNTVGVFVFGRNH